MFYCSYRSHVEPREYRSRTKQGPANVFWKLVLLLLLLKLLLLLFYQQYTLGCQIISGLLGSPPDQFAITVKSWIGYLIYYIILYERSAEGKHLYYIFVLSRTTQTLCRCIYTVAVIQIRSSEKKTKRHMVFNCDFIPTFKFKICNHSIVNNVNSRLENISSPDN